MAAAAFHVNVVDAAAAFEQQQQQQQQHLHQPLNNLPSPGTPSKVIPPDGLSCFGDERRMLQDQAKFYNSPTLSDVTLLVGDQTYHAHKLLLIRSSDVFERMFSSEWADPDKKEFELKEESMCVEIFPCFLKFLYSCHVSLHLENTLPLLVLADKYNISELQKVCIDFARTHIITKLQLKDVFHVWFQYATKCYHDGLVSACVTALSQKMDEITLSAEWEQEWIHLERDQLVEFLRSSNLVIKDEYEIWLGVLKWLQSPRHPERMVKMETHLKTILPHIRFPMMTADQLCEAEKCRLVDQYPFLFHPYLMQAYKYHSLSLHSRGTNKFSTSNFLLRNYTDLRWDKRLVLNNLSAIQKFSEACLRFSTRAATFPPQTWEWELKCHPKGFSSTSEDLRCVLCSNLILDQPRPVEFLLSIVDNEHIICTVTGKKNFSKNRYNADTEIDKKVSVADLCELDSKFLVNDCLIMQITLKPVE